MTTKTTSRRAILAGAAALPALATTSLAAESTGDPELRRLWVDYLRFANAHAVAKEKMAPARAAFDAELPPCPEGMCPGDHWRAHKSLWHKHGCEVLYAAFDATDTSMRETVAAILASEAHTLFGIGVKLCALPAEHEEEDLNDIRASVLPDIDRLTGASFAETLPQDDDDVAVQS